MTEQNEIKMIHIGMKEVKVTLFEDDRLVYISDLKDFTSEFLNLINNFSKVTGYNIKSNKSVALLYSKDKQSEKEIRKMTPFTIVSNYIKFLAVTLTKQLKDLYDKNFKS